MRELTDDKDRIYRLERAMFGFRRDDDGIWVDGILQQMSDARHEARVIVKILMVALPFVIISSATGVANSLHAYGFLGGLVNLIKDFVP